jgi:hypothetical protein
MNVLPEAPSVAAFRSISECRVYSVATTFQKHMTKLLIYIHTSEVSGSKTSYFIERVNKKPAVVTYVNNKRVDVREINL